MEAIVLMIGMDPMIGDIMLNCGGARKLRVARQGGGKSGGYRLVTYFGGDDIPVFIIAIFGKNEKANLNSAEQNALAALTKRLREY